MKYVGLFTSINSERKVIVKLKENTIYETFFLISLHLLVQHNHHFVLSGSDIDYASTHYRDIEEMSIYNKLCSIQISA